MNANQGNQPGYATSYEFTKAPKQTRRQLAQSPSTPPTDLLLLAKDESSYVRTAVAKNTRTPPEGLLVLAKSKEVEIRYFVVKHPHVPPEALLELANDRYSMVYKIVAKHPSTPPEALLQLANNDDLFVRQKVSANPHTPPAALAMLSCDVRWEVRYYVAQNLKTPIETLEKLALDSCEGVIIQAVKNPLVTQEKLGYLYKKLVNSGKLDECVVASLLSRGVLLEQTEVCALVACYGEAIAKIVAKSGKVVKNSTLDKQLLQLGITSVYQNKEQQEKEANKCRL